MDDILHPEIECTCWPEEIPHMVGCPRRFLTKELGTHKAGNHLWSPWMKSVLRERGEVRTCLINGCEETEYRSVSQK